MNAYFGSFESLKRANKRAGYHFFDESAMEFFDSRIESSLIVGRFFVTSEQFHSADGTYHGERTYTIREAQPNGAIETIGEVGGYLTVREAGREIERLLRVERQWLPKE